MSDFVSTWGFRTRAEIKTQMRLGVDAPPYIIYNDLHLIKLCDIRDAYT